MPNIDKKLDVSADLTTVYEGGELNQITIAELLNNKVAIKQLVNQHNNAMIELKNKQNEITTILSKNKFLNTTPFNSIVSAIFYILCSIIIGLGVNYLDNNVGKYLIYIGAIMVLVSSISNILYTYIYSWFNKK